jgi:hypothetical protein
MTRWTEVDLQRVNQRLKQALDAPLIPTHEARPKYGNHRIEENGLPFDSKKELADWKALELQRISGAIRGVARQVSIPLPGTTRRIRVDFMVIENDGRVRWFDSKGCDTAIGRLKRQQVLDGYGINVELI